MTRLTRADFENMTIGQLAKLLNAQGVSLKTDANRPSESVVYAARWVGQLPYGGFSGRGSNVIDAMLDALSRIAPLGYFDSAQPFPAVAQTTPSDSIPIGSEGDSSNESET